MLCGTRRQVAGCAYRPDSQSQSRPGFVCFLIFCTFVVIRTGGTAGLQDVAVAVRAYASVSTSLRTGLRIGKKR
jgi:hypothetical protein